MSERAEFQECDKCGESVVAAAWGEHECDECEHEWNAEITSMFSNEFVTAVKCKKCGVSGEQDRSKG